MSVRMLIGQRDVFNLSENGTSSVLMTGLSNDQEENLIRTKQGLIRRVPCQNS